MEVFLQINILYQVFHPLVTCCIFPLVTLTVLNLKIAKGKILFGLIFSPSDRFRILSYISKI